MADKDRSADSGDPEERDDDIVAVRLQVTPDQARELVESGQYDTGDHPRYSPRQGGTGTLDLFMSRTQADDLRARGIAFEIASNQSARARARIAELGDGDRYEGGAVTPRGIGRKIGGRGGGSSQGTERRS